MAKEKEVLDPKAVSAFMLSEVLHEKNPFKYPKNYVTLENYDMRKEEVARIFTQED